MTRFQTRLNHFRALHEHGCFVMPNPWDRGSAVILERLGYQALASSSAGYAFTQALPDTVEALSVEAVLRHLADLVEATTLPINADFQQGYAPDAEGVAKNVRRCVETGVAGLSIEDATGDAASPLFPLEVAVERLKAAREAIDASGSGVLLTARAECFLVNHESPLDESIRRLKAYAEAGADVLFAPGPRDAVSIQALVQAVAPKPLNVVIGGPAPLKVADLAALGVRRISTGGAFARVAWTAVERAAKLLNETGDFSVFENLLSTPALSEKFSQSRPEK